MTRENMFLHLAPLQGSPPARRGGVVGVVRGVSGVKSRLGAVAALAVPCVRFGSGPPYSPPYTEEKGVLGIRIACTLWKLLEDSFGTRLPLRKPKDLWLCV